MESCCEFCRKSTTTLARFRDGSLHVLCGQECADNLGRKETTPILVATWTSDDETSKMEKQRETLTVEWHTAHRNRTVIFQLNALRSGDAAELREIIADIDSAAKWIPATPGGGDDMEPSRSATIYPLETTKKHLDGIRSWVGQ